MGFSFHSLAAKHESFLFNLYLIHRYQIFKTFLSHLQARGRARKIQCGQQTDCQKQDIDHPNLACSPNLVMKKSEKQSFKKKIRKEMPLV